MREYKYCIIDGRIKIWYIEGVYEIGFNYYDFKEILIDIHAHNLMRKYVIDYFEACLYVSTHISEDYILKEYDRYKRGV